MLKAVVPLKGIAIGLALVFSASCGNGLQALKERGIVGPIFNVLDGKIIISLKLLNFPFPGGVGGSLPIPRTNDSQFEAGPNILEGGTLIQLHVDPEDIKGVEVADDPNTLPDGRPLPGVPGGILPSLRIDTQLLRTTFYFHTKLFGLYVPFDFNTYGLSAYYDIHLNGVSVGTIGIVKSDDQGKNTGIVLFLRMEALQNTQVKRLLEKSRRNPGKLF